MFVDLTKVLALQLLEGSNEEGRRWRSETTRFGILSDWRFLVLASDLGIDNELNVV
jgi:hypothetical protein